MPNCSSPKCYKTAPKRGKPSRCVPPNSWIVYRQLVAKRGLTPQEISDGYVRWKTTMTSRELVCARVLAPPHVRALHSNAMVNDVRSRFSGEQRQRAAQARVAEQGVREVVRNMYAQIQQQEPQVAARRLDIGPIIPVPEYHVHAEYDAYILCGGMNFRHPHGAPQHTDDIRLRALAYITDQDTRVKSVGFSHDNEPYHMYSNLRDMKKGRHPSTWRVDALECTVFVLDYYWTQRGYFRDAHAQGYGGKWFARGGQIAQMLGASREPQARTIAVLLPNDRQGEMMQLFEQGRHHMEAEGICVEELNEAVARAIHPLVVATLFAEKRTTWPQMRPGDQGGVWHRYEEGAGRSTLNQRHPFLLCYSRVRSPIEDMEPLEATCTYLSSLVDESIRFMY